MSRTPHSGYVFGIRNPLIQDDLNIFYVGVSHRPWEAIQRLMNRPPNSIYGVVEEIKQNFPEGLTVFGEVICNIYEGDVTSLPEVATGSTILEWMILGYESDDAIQPRSTNPVPFKLDHETLKNRFIRELTQAGHPIKNGKAGRPRQPEPLPQVTEDMKRMKATRWTRSIDRLRGLPVSIQYTYIEFTFSDVNQLRKSLFALQLGDDPNKIQMYKAGLR